ncbi:hypothetical protein LTS18_004882, partial [Coniosporium uncinatum]
LSEEGEEVDLLDDVEDVETGDRVKNGVLGLLGATSVGVESVEETRPTGVRDDDSTVFELAMTLLVTMRDNNDDRAEEVSLDAEPVEEAEALGVRDDNSTEIGLEEALLGMVRGTVGDTIREGTARDCLREEMNVDVLRPGTGLDASGGPAVIEDGEEGTGTDSLEVGTGLGSSTELAGTDGGDGDGGDCEGGEESSEARTSPTFSPGLLDVSSGGSVDLADSCADNAVAVSLFIKPRGATTPWVAVTKAASPAVGVAAAAIALPVGSQELSILLTPNCSSTVVCLSR